VFFSSTCGRIVYCNRVDEDVCRGTVLFNGKWFVVAFIYSEFFEKYKLKFIKEFNELLVR